ncbi:DUF4190 domain-containing protein [Streptomyces sp. Je 1-79]|uniref:DUF4190 domain-containing protein n=1 Tax=Streptomyces sp. Je 1-79 TaxID=2943847 RepID=UPI0021A7E8E7|nr:DUF4190 domain-containing protein [Streptomyces sp. Je 1-79]MCT4352989.1 DUF4190 domain-containing protein [Streptomyces sp. Je 1-79]
MTTPTNTPGQNPWGPPAGVPGMPGMPGMPPQPPFQQPRNGLGVTALVLGIVGLLFALFPFSFWLGAILGVLALIFGIIGHSRARKGEATNKGMALTGLILGAVSIVVSIVWLIVVATAVKDIADDIDEEIKKQEKASAAPADPGTDDAPEAEPTETAPAALKFGEAFTYPDGVKVTVSKPRAYKPDQFAAGHTKGNSAFQVTITIVNGSDKAIDVSTALPDASDAQGAQAEAIFDGSNATEMFRGKVLPGKQAKSDFAFSLPADADDEMQIEVGPTVVEYENAIWTGSTK